MATRKKSPTFEDSLEQLEQLVEDMEVGDLSLENALKSFEKGVKLTRTCQLALNEAEQKVEVLLGKGEDFELSEFKLESDLD